MITIDTSTLVAYFAGEKGPDVENADIVLRDNVAVLTPVVISELLSDPKLPKNIEDFLLTLPCVELKEGYWQRSGKLRRKIIAEKRKARLADTLIAQCCIDNNLTLITRDKDFSVFENLSSLKLA